ncbi:MAG: hypothetical protein QW641_02520 [Candidatus Aenigmatarchaeota archaeon]
MIKKIILDTSFLVSCVKYKIDLKSEIENLIGKFEVILPQQVMKEIKRKKMDKFLEELNYNITKIKAKNADESIIKLAEKNNYFVATVDKKLRSYLKNKKIKTFYIRNFSKVCLE